MIILKIIEMLDYSNLVIKVSESDFLRNFTGIGMGKVMSFGYINGAVKCISIGKKGTHNEAELYREHIESFQNA